MENPMGFSHFLSTADLVACVVLSLMLLASISTWYLIIKKGFCFLRMRKKSAAFLETFWAAPNVETVAARLHEDATEPFSHLLYHGFTTIEQSKRRAKGDCPALIDSDTPDELLTRALKRAIDKSKSRLESGQTLLATIASAAPFVGLFGTVWGIYHALLSIGQTGQSSLGAVAGPVGEALIMTAIGLAVALPASIAYNVFARLNRNLLGRLDAFAHDVSAFLSTGVKSTGRSLT